MRQKDFGSSSSYYYSAVMIIIVGDISSLISRLL